MVVYTGGRIRRKRIRTVVVKNGVRAIDDNAFTECPKLRRITIPNSVTSIGERAFGVLIGGHIGYRALIGLTKLETISIPDSVRTIGDWAFAYCVSLNAIVIPEGVTEIEKNTFAGCRSLESITFPKSLTKIGESAFEDCTTLEQVEFPNGIKVIQNDAFAGCTSLHTITLPPTIEEFGKNAFDRCTNLHNFIIPNGLPALKDGFDPSDVGFESFVGIKQIVANASTLTRMTITTRYSYSDNDILKALELVSACATLREVDLSRNYFSVGVFEILASQDIPGHLRLLQINWSRWKEASSSPEHLLRLLERNPKLAIKTNKFWDDSEDDKVRHQLDMNEYGCLGFMVRDSRWPELIETVALLEEEGELQTDGSNNILKQKRDRRIRRAANILYPLLLRQLDVLLNYQQRHRSPQLRSNRNSGCENNLATAPSVDNVDTIIQRWRDRLHQQKVEIKEKEDEIKKKDATIKEKDKEIKEKDAKIEGKDKEIKEKDKEIIRLRRLLEQSSSTAYANEKTAGSKRTRLK